MIIENIKKSQIGDKNSTKILIDKFYPLLIHHAKMLSYEDSYNDLIVDFIELIHNIRIDQISNISEGGLVSYIKTSIRNSYIKRLISLKKSNMFILYSELSDRQLNFIEASSASYDTYTTLDIDFIQSLLTKSEATVIIMIFYQGFSVSETASYCHITRQAVNQMKNRALRKLKNSFR